MEVFGLGPGSRCLVTSDAALWPEQPRGQCLHSVFSLRQPQLRASRFFLAADSYNETLHDK